MSLPNLRGSRHGAALLALIGSALISLPALLGGNLPVAGQTAGPVATRTAPIVAGPDNGGVAIAPSFSSEAAVAGLNAAAQAATPAHAGAQPVAGAGRSAVLPPPNQILSPAAASETGQGNANVVRPAANLNLTPTGGVSLIAGQALLFVPSDSASCAATAELASSRDQATFTARCASGGTLSLGRPGLLCMEPSPQAVASALGNLENLSLTAGQPLSSRLSPSGVLVCAAAPAPGTYALSVTRKDPPRPALHSLPRGVRVNLPAVGAGGLLDR